MRYILQAAALAMFFVFADAGNSVDKLPNCKEMADNGYCQDKAHTQFMVKNCAASCEKVPGIRKVEMKPIKEGNPSFFDLSAEDAKGNTIEFEEFEGYVTLVVNVARKCGETEFSYQKLDHFMEIWPFTLEIVVFPFRSAHVTENPADCPSHKKSDLSKERMFRVMKEVEINGPNAHPVFKFFKALFEIEEFIDESYVTFYLVTPDGNSVVSHQGPSEEGIKRYIADHMKYDLAGRAKIGEL